MKKEDTKRKKCDNLGNNEKEELRKYEKNMHDNLGDDEKEQVRKNEKKERGVNMYRL